MILKILILFFSVLILSLLISFTFFVLQPSIESKNGIFDNLIINLREMFAFKVERKRNISVSEKKAFIIHQKNRDIHSQPLDFNVMYTCKMLKSLYFTDKSYRFVCMGQGDCLKVCEQKAISFEGELPVVNQMCCGCKKCQDVCPQNLIVMVKKDVESLEKADGLEDDILLACEKGIIEKKVIWKPKKHFKLWAYCYKIIDRFVNF